MMISYMCHIYDNAAWPKNAQLVVRRSTRLLTRKKIFGLPFPSSFSLVNTKPSSLPIYLIGKIFGRGNFCCQSSNLRCKKGCKNVPTSLNPCSQHLWKKRSRRVEQIFKDSSLKFFKSGLNVVTACGSFSSLLSFHPTNNVQTEHLSPMIISSCLLCAHFRKMLCLEEEGDSVFGPAPTASTPKAAWRPARRTIRWRRVHRRGRGPQRSRFCVKPEQMRDHW